MARPPKPAGDPVWYVLIHQLPPRPLYLRAKIRRRLAKVGALPVKNSVYVLPDRTDSLEDFQWIAQEAVAGGGDACVCRAEFVEGLSTEAIVERFQSAVAARYEPVKTALNRVLDQMRQASRTRGATAGQAAARLLRLRKQADDIAQVDFFESTAGREITAIMSAIERTRARAAGGRKPVPAAAAGDLVGRVWVTRQDPHIDRLATAWLIRRFVDPAARFRFVPTRGGSAGKNERSFDMTGADFTHAGDQCTFETMVARLGLKNAALGQIAEIVHDIDLKDSKFGRPDAAGVRQLVQGLAGAHRDSSERIAAALPVFDALYASFGGRR